MSESAKPTPTLLATTAEEVRVELQSLSCEPAFAPFLILPEGERMAAGYGHTVREILQQPLMLRETAARIAANERAIAEVQKGAGVVAITGSGSSHYAAALAAPAVEAGLGVPVLAVASGDFLTDGVAAAGPLRPLLLVSLARSGNSPESVWALQQVAKQLPDSRFLNITCNPDGKLAATHLPEAAVESVVLNPLTNDQSLVMTSSFTSLALAAAGLGFLNRINEYLQHTAELVGILETRLPGVFGRTSALPFDRIRRAVFLGAGSQLAAAREAALKLTEMTAGRIVAFSESFLGLRHGPMAAVNEETLVVAFLPSGAPSRAYACDLLKEAQRKQLGCATLIVEPNGSLLQDVVPASASPDGALPDFWAAIFGVIAGQCLGFHACRYHSLSPDAPSAQAVITRVVEPFPLYP